MLPLGRAFDKLGKCGPAPEGRELFWVVMLILCNLALTFAAMAMCIMALGVLDTHGATVWHNPVAPWYPQILQGVLVGTIVVLVYSALVSLFDFWYGAIVHDDNTSAKTRQHEPEGENELCARFTFVIANATSAVGMCIVFGMVAISNVLADTVASMRLSHDSQAAKDLVDDVWAATWILLTLLIVDSVEYLTVRYWELDTLMVFLYGAH
jgi:hypothetical protein